MLPSRRGRLSSIDLLPPDAQEDVEWALKELAARKQTQEDILESFNLRLAVKGLGPISKSAFNRHSLRTAKHAWRMGETREIAAVLATKFDQGTDEKLTILVSETIKTLIFEMLENAGTLKATPLTAEMVFNLAGALKSAEQAEKVAADKKQVTDKFVEATKSRASDAIDKVAEIKGLSAEAKEAFRRELFGIIDGR